MLQTRLEGLFSTTLLRGRLAGIRQRQLRFHGRRVRPAIGCGVARCTLGRWGLNDHIEWFMFGEMTILRSMNPAGVRSNDHFEWFLVGDTTILTILTLMKPGQEAFGQVTILGCVVLGDLTILRWIQSGPTHRYKSYATGLVHYSTLRHNHDSKTLKVGAANHSHPHSHANQSQLVVHYSLCRTLYMV